MRFGPTLELKNHRNVAWISYLFYEINNLLVVFKGPEGLNSQIKIGWIIIVLKSEKIAKR